MFGPLRLNTHRNEALLGAGLAIVTGVVFFLLPDEYTIELGALLLAVIAAIYVGFALADGRDRETYIEIAGATAFVVVALLGLWLHPYWIAAGLILHAPYDLLHHDHGIQTEITDGYPPLCLTYDVLAGVAFFAAVSL